MVFSFNVIADTGDVFRVILSSGEDAFFATPEICSLLNNEIEIVEIDLERVTGSAPTSLKTLTKISEGIAHCFEQNKKAVLYYFCDDLSEVPSIGDSKIGMWPQEYRSLLFSRMFERYALNTSMEDSVTDVEVVIYEDTRPLYMHLIARTCHSRYIEALKAYITSRYSK